MQKFLTIENFILAYNRLQTVKMNYYKETYINDLNNFGLNLETNIESLINSIEKDLYKPSDGNKIYIPKADSTVRVITVLSFIDLLIYQAIINVLADIFYDNFKYKTNKYVFGNIYNESSKPEERIFFYSKWTKQWKIYNHTSIKYFERGFKFKCEFDLASFYDTIDHSILISFIKRKIDDKKLFEILGIQLRHFSCDYDRVNIKKNIGIPQGPSVSGFLAEIVLDYIDKKMIKFVSENPSLKYLRYVDDIKLFAIDEDCGKRALAYLDLLSRDLGLIPKSSKLGIKLIENKNELIKDNKKISHMAIQYRNNGRLKKSQNRKLIANIKKDLNSDNLKNKTYDKTKLKFAMYKIDPDNELKNILIENISQLYVCFEDICYYLSKNFIKDPDVKVFIYGLLNNNVPYNYLIAIIFKYFYSIIDFNIEIYEKYFNEARNKYWYIRYFMLDWIKNKKPSILNIVSEDNSIVKRKLDYYKYLETKDKQTKELMVQTLIKDKNIETALLGQRLLSTDISLWGTNIDDIGAALNEFIKRINNVPVSENYINLTLNEYYGISNGEYLFNNEYWTNEDLLNINKIFKNGQEALDEDASVWIAYINTFNHLVTVKLLEMSGVRDFNKKEFNNILNKSGFMRDNYPKAFDVFTRINRRRNEIPLSHPYDRDGKIGKHIDKNEKSNYKKYFKQAMEEILIILEGKSKMKI